MLCRGPLRYFFDPLRWRLPRQALVLEVGSGQKPMWRADVLVDRYLHDDAHRPGPLCVSRPIVCADIEDLPFEDDAFDFVYCSHVLEHVGDPVAAAGELGRVGSSGIIAVPSRSWEREHDCSDHRWIFALENGVLGCAAKPSDASAIRGRDDSDEVVVRWDGMPEGSCRVDVSRGQAGCDRTESGSAIQKRPLWHVIRPVARRLMVQVGALPHHLLSRHWRVDMLALLRCLECRGCLAENGDEQALLCASCGREYRVQDGIPIMLREG